MLLIGIIRKLSSQSAVLAPALSYFFCQSRGKTELPLNNATAALRSLIWMLLLQQPDLIKHLHTDYKSAGEALFTDMNAPVAVRRIFETMLKEARPVYLIVDALDECDQGVEDLIEVISTSLTLSNKVRWLVSSRPEVDILTKINNPAVAETIVELDMQSRKSLVEKYIKYKLSELKRSEVGDTYTTEIQAAVLHEVVGRAEDNLLWISLVFKDFKTVHGKWAVKKVKNYPPGLSKLYDHKMTRLEKTEYPKYCKDILVAASLTYRPLSLSELAVLFPWSDETDPYTIVEEFESFLTITEETVSLNHKSAKDYMIEYQSKLQGGIFQGHADISRRSIDAMSKGLKKNIYPLPNVGLTMEDITAPSTDPLEGLQYSCVYWVQHLQATSAQYRDYSCIYRFLQLRLLHWLEALCWIGKISDGILAISSLEALSLVSFSYHLLKRIVVNLL
jgi:NACHT domain